MKSVKRICCFCERWESGGIESFLYNVLTRIDLTDLKVDIVAASLGDSIFTKPLKNRGICFYELSGSQRNILANYKRFRKLIRERRYSVLHLNAFHGLTLAYLKIAQEEGIPTRIAHSHNTALRKSVGGRFKLILHTCARHRYIRYATELWACSKTSAEFLFSKRDLQKRGFRFIPNGIDTERFRFDPIVRDRVRAELGIENDFVIGHIGRLCYQKNQSFLLDVLVEALKKNTNTVLLLVGEGEDRNALKKRAVDLHISDKVVFYGTTSRPEDLLCAMDVFAFPSLFEGFGIVAIEALTDGLPVICSENLPEEVYISPRIQTIPLLLGPSAWASALLINRGHESEMGDTVKKAGFEIAHTAHLVSERFTSKATSAGEEGHVTGQTSSLL